MSRKPHTFKKRDLIRAISAAKDAGLKSYRVEIAENGKPVVIVVDSGLSTPPIEDTGEVVL